MRKMAQYCTNITHVSIVMFTPVCRPPKTRRMASLGAAIATPAEPICGGDGVDKLPRPSSRLNKTSLPSWDRRKQLSIRVQIGEAGADALT